MKYLMNRTKRMAWTVFVIMTIMLQVSCGKQEGNRFVFHSAEEALATCRQELAAFRDIKEADIEKLTAVVSTWLELQDSVYSYMSNDTTIQMNSQTASDYYIVSDSIKNEIMRIAKLQPRTMREITYLKVQTAHDRKRILSSEDYKAACKIFNDMEKEEPYRDMTTTIDAYNTLLDTTTTFTKENEVVAFLRTEDKCFRSLMNHLTEVRQEDLAIITNKTSALFDDLYARVTTGEKNAISERMSLFLTMRFNRRILQNAEACMRDIKSKMVLNEQQKDNYRWMLIQPFMSIDNYSMASLTEDQEKTFLQLSDELPYLFAYIDGTSGDTNELKQMKEILTDFFLNSYLKSSL